MVTIVKHEWHQVDSQSELDFDAELLSEIYPDLSEEEIDQLLTDLQNGDADIDDIVSDAINNDVELEWDHTYDDWWTDRKGGYDITYEIGDNNE